MSRERWDSRNDGPFYSCIAITAFFILLWLAVLVRLGVFR